LEVAEAEVQRTCKGEVDRKVWEGNPREKERGVDIGGARGQKCGK